MTDLISRQNIIDSLEFAVQNAVDNGDVTEKESTKYLPKLIDWLNSIPSADRPKGEWIRNEDAVLARYTCSECGTYAICKENFCHGCGADMRGKDDCID